MTSLKKELITEKYLNLTKILQNQRTINIIATATGVRKTTYFAEWAKRQTDDGKIVIWIRRRKDDISFTVVDLFQRIYGEGAKVTGQGVTINKEKVIYFIPLSLYYKYKGLTKIAHRLAAIIYDEAIPMENESWIKGSMEREEIAFGQLINIGARDQKIPVYFLCNPNTLGVWFIQRYAPQFKPDPKKEKLETTEHVLSYSMPWLGKEDRGTVEHFETKADKQVTKLGVYQSKEYRWLTDKQPKTYICNLIIGNKELQLGRTGTNYIITQPTRKKNLKIITFKRQALINHPTATLHTKELRNQYIDWLTTLWSKQRLYFQDPNLRSHLEDNLDREYFW